MTKSVDRCKGGVLRNGISKPALSFIGFVKSGTARATRTHLLQSSASWLHSSFRCLEHDACSETVSMASELGKLDRHWKTIRRLEIANHNVKAELRWQNRSKEPYGASRQANPSRCHSFSCAPFCHSPVDVGYLRVSINIHILCASYPLLKLIMTDTISPLQVRPLTPWTTRGSLCCMMKSGRYLLLERS